MVPTRELNKIIRYRAAIIRDLASPQVNPVLRNTWGRKYHSVNKLGTMLLACGLACCLLRLPAPHADGEG